MDQDDPTGARYALDLTLTFRVTDYPALSRACLDAALSEADQPSDDYVAFLQSDPMHGIVDLAVRALRAGMRGIEIELETAGFSDAGEDIFDDWPPENPPWPDAENVPDDD